MLWLNLLTAVPIEIDRAKIDFSTMDTVAGSIAGMIVTAMVFVFIGYFLIKFGIINFGHGESNLSCTPQPERCIEHSGVVKDVSFVASECKSIWLEIKEINNRQMALRVRLPAEYVSKDDLRGIQERLKAIDNKLDRYLELTVKL